MACTATDPFLHHLRTVLSPVRREAATDGELLTRWAAERDASAFAALVGRHGSMVWRVGRGVLQQTQDAEDAFQATFLVLARKAAVLRGRSSVAGWLFQTARRLALKARTATARRLRREACAVLPVAVDPLDEISVREAQAVLAEELHRLSAVYREPLLLCLYEGITQDEAARQLGCSRSTLKRRLEQGRTRLGRRLERRGLALSGVLALTLMSRSRLSAEVVRRTVAAAGQGATGTAARLADGILRTMLLKKLALHATVGFVLGSLALTAGLALKAAAPTPPAASPPAAQLAEARTDAAPRRDRHGDPLPSGVVARIGSIHFRHGGSVTGAVYTSDGKAIATTSSDGFLRLWDARTGKLRWRFAIAKDDYQHALAVSGDAKTVAVLSDFEFALVAADTGKALARHSWPRVRDENYPRSLAISADLRTLARGCFDATVRLYDAGTGQELRRIRVGDKAQQQFPLTIQFAADGKTILVGAYATQALVSYDVASGEPVQTLKVGVELGVVHRLVVSPDQRLLAAMSRGNPPGSPDRVVLWDLAAGKLRHTIELPFLSLICGAFSADGATFAVGGQDRDMLLLDTATGKERRRLHWHPSPLSLVFSPDGKTLASGDNGGAMALWDVATGKLRPPSPDPSGSLYGLGFVAGGKELISFSDGVYWWDVASGRLLRNLPRDPTWSLARTVSPDGKLLATSAKGEIVLMDTHTGRVVLKLSGEKNRPAAFSPDGKRLYSVGDVDSPIIIWDVATGKRLHRLDGQQKWVQHAVVSPDGRWLASWTSDRTVFAPLDFDIRIWDAATGKLVHRLKPKRGSAFALAFSADGSRLVSVGGEPGRRNDRGEVELWDLATGRRVREFTGHEERVMCVALSPDGRTLATGSIDRTLRLWEVATGAERRRIVGHEGYVHSVAFSPDGRLLAAASDDAPVYIWNVYDPKR